MELTKTKSSRNVSLDLLRVISMLMIILLHSIDHSGLYESLKQGTVMYYAEQFLFSAVQVCVNVFVLISGYFLINSMFKLKKLGLLWVEVVFYSLIIRVVMIALGQQPFSISSIVSCFVPVITGRYWFVTIYFGMYLLFPFLNKGLRALSKRQYKILICILFVLFSVMISIHPQLKGMNSGASWGLPWFVVLYITAGYFRLHYDFDKALKPINCILVYFGVSLFSAICVVVGDISNIGLLKSATSNLLRYDSVASFIASIALFVAFLNINMQKKSVSNSLIMKLSSATFGVYLIHAHADLFSREDVWHLVKIPTYMNEWWFVFYQIGVVFAVFVACTIIEIIRQWIFRIIRLDKFICFVSDTIENKIINQKV